MNGGNSLKADIIVSWPQHMDYPLWRQFIHDNREKFAKVIVVFTDMSTGRDYRRWLQEELKKDDILSISNDAVTGNEDWRNVAVNKGLGYSTAEWVWFTEQDFFPEDDFWDVVKELSKSTGIFGYFQENRLHPCCIFIKRSLLDTTKKDFGVVKDRLDHFGLLQEEIDERGIPVGIISSYWCFHYNGLSQNMWMLMNGEEPNYDPPRFKDYCRDCLKVEVPIEPHIKEYIEAYAGYN